MSIHTKKPNYKMAGEHEINLSSSGAHYNNTKIINYDNSVNRKHVTVSLINLKDARLMATKVRKVKVKYNKPQI